MGTPNNDITNKHIIVPLIPYFDKPNANGRIYTEECIDNMVAQFNERIVPMFGQMGFPDDCMSPITMASHEVTKIWKDPDAKQLMGEIKLIDTPDGRAISEMVKRGMIVFRSRSLGTVNPDNTVNITKLISFDAISYQDDGFNPDIKPTEEPPL